MIDQNDIQKIKEATLKFFQVATIEPTKIEVVKDATSENGEVVNISLILNEPQILIGEKGQTLFEIQRLLKIILNKKIQKIFYVNLDINEYKNKKTEYLKEIAKDLANEVAITKQEKVLVPMSSYERRVVHAELSKRSDVITESAGQGIERHIIIKSK
jgi:spoIIIJ-associated protein